MNSTSNESVEPDSKKMAAALMPLSRATLTQVRQDAPLYALVGAYALVAWILSLYLGESQRYRPFQYVMLWMILSILVLAVTSAARAFWINPGRPLSSFVSMGKKHWNRDFLQRLPVILVTGTFYGVFTSVKNMLPDIHPFSWDPTLAAIDYKMLGDHDGWSLAAAIIPDGLPLKIIDIIYSRGWLIIVMSLSAYVAASPTMRRYCRQYFLTFFISWIFAGNILACIFMSGGPCFYAEFVGDHLRFAGLMQSISGTGSAAVQDYLWNTHVNGWNNLGAGISAFPSVHMVSMTLVTLLLRKMSVRLCWVGIFLTIAMELGSVRLGWHYVSDGLVGIAIAVMIWRFIQMVERSVGRSDVRLA